MEHSPVAAEAVRVMISPAVRTLTAELTIAAMCSRSAPILSATSTHWAATKAAAEATAMDILEDESSDEDAAVAAVTAAIADATPATVTAAWTCAFWERFASFRFSFRSLIQRPIDFPLNGVRTMLKLLWNYKFHSNPNYSFMRQEQHMLSRKT